MNLQTNGEKEDPNSQNTSNKVKNIILVNNNTSPNGRPSSDLESWPGDGLFGGNKMFQGGGPFITETLQKPGISNLFNFNAGICPEFDNKKDYYKEFWRVYLQNEIILIDMKDYVLDIKNLQDQIKKVEDHHLVLEAAKQESLKEKGLEKKKNRRPANEIQKNHLCPYESCNKFYGSEVSLNLHIKLKHKGGNKTDREKLAISILKAKMSGEDLPELNLNLPPGFLEMYQTQIQNDGHPKTEKTENSIRMDASFESQNPFANNYNSRKTSVVEQKFKMEFNTKSQALGIEETLHNDREFNSNNITKDGLLRLQKGIQSQKAVDLGKKTGRDTKKIGINKKNSL